MRAMRGLFCAVVLTAFLAPGIGADEYTKQTFLTFSGPVQLPGITLPAGTYQFKLADPASGRRTLQVWDEEGTKLYTTLLTIPDRRMTPSDEPVVMFTETAAGEAQPIRAWFYPNETYGMEFVYPKEQALRIAQATHRAVLSFDNDATNRDEEAYRAARIGRLDEKGTMADADKSEHMTAANAEPESTTAPAAAATTADNSPAQSSTPGPSANRTDPSAVGTSGSMPRAAADTSSEANRDNLPENRAVGTSGSTNTASSANRTAQAGAGANAAAPGTNEQSAGTQPTATSGSQDAARTLPSTASPATVIQLLAGLSLAGAFGVRLFRSRGARV